MSILDGIKGKAQELLKIAEPSATRATVGYDASKNSIIVAGFPLDAVVSSSVSADSVTRQEVGIDYYYTTYYEVITQRTLTVTVLPTAKCLQVLRLLALRQLETKGWFNISVSENGNIVNVYRGYIMDLPELDMSQDAANRVITFGVKTMYSGVSVIDQETVTEKEIYTSTGSRPDKGGIDEDTGALTDIPHVPLPVEISPEPYIGGE